MYSILFCAVISNWTDTMKTRTHTNPVLYQQDVWDCNQVS